MVMYVCVAKSRQDVIGVNCVKNANGKVLVENDSSEGRMEKVYEKIAE